MTRPRAFARIAPLVAAMLVAGRAGAQEAVGPGSDEPPPLAPLPPGLVPPPGAPVDRAPAPRADLPTSSWELFLTLEGSTSSYAYQQAPGADSHALAGTVTAGVTRFFAPVVDDGSPRSLQPFLQRASSFSGTFAFGGTRNTIGTGFLGETFTDLYFEPRFDVGVYLTPTFVLTAAFGYEYDVEDASLKTHRLFPSVGFGVRVGDTLISLGYAFEEDIFVGAGQQPKPLWGTLGLGARSVVARRLDLVLGGQVFDSGAGGNATVELYPTKDLGVFVGGYGYVGRTFFDTRTHHNDYGGDVGASFWVAPRIRLLAEYTISGRVADGDQLDGGYSRFTNDVFLSFLARL